MERDRVNGKKKGGESSTVEGAVVAQTGGCLIYIFPILIDWLGLADLRPSYIILPLDEGQWKWFSAQLTAASLVKGPAKAVDGLVYLPLLAMKATWR